MSLGLGSESDESSVGLVIGLGVLSELLELFIMFSDVDGRGLKSHLFAKQAKESLLPGRSLLVEDESVDEVVGRF
jgi:hypothetical protein